MCRTCNHHLDFLGIAFLYGTFTITKYPKNHGNIMTLNVCQHKLSSLEVASFGWQNTSLLTIMLPESILAHSHPCETTWTYPSPPPITSVCTQNPSKLLCSVLRLPKAILSHPHPSKHAHALTLRLVLKSPVWSSLLPCFRKTGLQPVF